MNNYKICVYCICKNESKFVDRFMDSLEEIKDHIYVLDTGSTDNTVELFKKRNAHVFEKKYDHFSFDVARNDALNLVPEDYDICISLDIDDVIQEGFINAINNIWDENTTQLEYMYYYCVDENDNPTVKQKINKIHSRKSYCWQYPIHEALMRTADNFKVKFANDILVIHKPDNEKSRAFYLDLLEERARAVPSDKRNYFLLAREYESRGKWFEGIKICHQYLDNNSYHYSGENMKVECILARIYRKINMYEESELWANKALNENQKSREPYLEKLIAYFQAKRYEDVIKVGIDALQIKDYNVEVIDDEGCWNGSIYDYISLAYYYLNDYDNAIKYIDMTIELNPKNERLKKNKALFLSTKLLNTKI